MRKKDFCFIFKEIDLFGKEPDIYYRGKQRKTSWMGRICTWIYICIYIFFFVYKVVRMFKRSDVSFSETNSSTGGLPKIQLNKELFTYAIALSDNYQKPFIDRGIYHPEGLIVFKRTINRVEQTYYLPLIFDICDINDFGKDHQKFAKNLNLSNFYCFKNLDVDFEGYSSAENSTQIMITINKCTADNNGGYPCKSDEEIYSKLNNQNLLIMSQDYDITPFDFENPVKPKLNINTCPISLTEYQTFVGYYQLTNIETDYNLFGFEALSDIRSKKYLVYHSALIMNTKRNELDSKIIQYLIVMNDKVLTNLRRYTQLVDVLGDVGGLMEVMESVFGVICILVSDILYDKTMVNNLFSFNLQDYMIKIKDKHRAKKSISEKIEKLSNFNNEDNFDKKTIDIAKKVRNKINHENTIYTRKDSIKPKVKINKSLNKTNMSNNNNNISSSRQKGLINKNTINIPKSAFVPKNNILKENNNEFDSNLNNIKIFENVHEILDFSMNAQPRVINKLNTNIFCTYFCFCCSRRRANFANILLDEAMGIITEKLDIYNIFRNMYYIDDIKNKNNYEFEDLEFTDDCKEKLQKVSNKIYNSFYQL